MAKHIGKHLVGSEIEVNLGDEIVCEDGVTRTVGARYMGDWSGDGETGTVCIWEFTDNTCLSVWGHVSTLAEAAKNTLIFAEEHV